MTFDENKRKSAEWYRTKINELKQQAECDGYNIGIMDISEDGVIGWDRWLRPDEEIHISERDKL